MKAGTEALAFVEAIEAKGVKLTAHSSGHMGSKRRQSLIAEVDLGGKGTATTYVCSWTRRMMEYSQRVSRLTDAENDYLIANAAEVWNAVNGRADG